MKDLLKEIERNKQEISEKNIRKPDKKFDWNNNELYDPETGAVNEQEYMNTKARYIDALKNIMEMKSDGFIPPAK